MEPLSAIQAELGQIKLVLIVMCTAITVAAIVAIVRGYLLAKASLRKFAEDHLTREIVELYDSNKLADVIARSRAALAEHPNHEYARWYLARALYLQSDFVASRREFEELCRICPSWRKAHIEPYLEEIERQQPSSDKK
jgi:hypothetical protein